MNMNFNRFFISTIYNISWYRQSLLVTIYFSWVHQSFVSVSCTLCLTIFSSLYFHSKMGRDEGVWRGKRRCQGECPGGQELFHQENKQRKKYWKLIFVHIRRVNAGEDYDHHYRRKSRSSNQRIKCFFCEQQILFYTLFIKRGSIFQEGALDNLSCSDGHRVCLRCRDCLCVTNAS